MAKIVVIGGTGLIGTKVVAKLTAHGHEAVAAAPNTGVDTLTGEGVADALDGADVVVDVSNSPSFEEKAVLDFFMTSTANLIEAEKAAGVGHHVALTIVGTNRPQNIPYFHAKVAQEKLIRESGVPYSLVHATQFFEFLGSIADIATDGDIVRLPGALIQPMAAEDVATAVARTATGSPVGDIEVAGPEAFGLDEFIRRGLTFRGDPRTVLRDDQAPYYGARIEQRTLLPVDGAQLFETRLEQWLPLNPPRAIMSKSGSATAPNTIVLIHGFWVTPRSWEHWKAHYEGKGFTVLTPAYPGFEVEVEALRADPTPIEKLEVPEIIAALESVIGGLDRPPIIMGHSAGGAFTQILLDHGYGAAGVAINSAPTEGVKVIPLSQIKSSFPVLKNPANRHRAVGLTPEQWYYVFANTFSEEESLALYERYHVPASGRLFWGSALANIHPGKDDTYVDYHNDARAPLLFISGKQDPLFPPKVGHSNVKHYKSNTVTEIVEYDGAHLLPANPAWEAIADFALDWALEQATSRDQEKAMSPA